MTMSDPIFGVSDALAVINQTLEMVYPSMTVVGELANFKIAKDRWVYADLKDDNAKMRLFGTVFQLPGPLEDGMMLEIIGEPRMHPQFGFSFQIRSIRPVGDGTIKKAADLLRAKLEAEGLFAKERKRALPYPPSHIALVSSEKSAAYADFMKILNVRWPYMQIDVYDSAVQGQAAVEELVNSIHAVNNAAAQPEALIMIRGGGSADDLAAFSSEQVTRAVAASRVPTLVAIGHEIDMSLAELAADMRASTPSNAAELLTPDVKDVKKSLADQKSFLGRVVDDELKARRSDLEDLKTDLDELAAGFIAAQREYLQRSLLRLDSYHPKQVLKHGYALIRREGKLIRDTGKIKRGDLLEIELEKSTLETTVQSMKKKEV
jgi:exodeoxyribonuclease VII large subunit